MKRKVNEIFFSLQGEGYNTGTAAVFVRFSGCNLRCGFCDTAHQDGVWMEDGEIVDAVASWPAAPMIVLTGGEPSLFIDRDFVKMLKDRTGKRVAVETNGTRHLPDNVDWVTLSPKDAFTEGAEVVLDRCDELKVVYTGQPLERYFSFRADHYFLQPCHTDDPQECRKGLEQTVEAVMKDPRWRLSLQIHRYLGIR